MSAPAAAEAVEGGVRTAGKAAYAGGSALARCTRGCCNMFGGCIKRLNPETVALMLRVINLVNAVLLGFACWFAYTLVGTGDVTRAFLATYIGIFAVLLLLFETRVKYTSKWIRRNFGFLFTYTGRTIFLIFLGAVCFGMLDPKQDKMVGYTWCLTVGMATIANSIFNCFIICNHPGFQEMNKNDAHSAPAGGDPSKMTDAQIRAYLDAHPEVAARVGTEGHAAHAEDVAVAVDGGADWASGAGKPAGGSGGSGTGSGGGGFGGMFGFGKKKTPTSGGAATPAAAAAFSGSTDTYQPPSIPAAAASYSAPEPASSYSPPAAAAPAPAAPAPAAPASSNNFAIEDDNPFASNSENPYGGK